MLLLFLAALSGATPTAVDAERTFNQDAHAKGQWTASRQYAHPDAVVFTPQAVWARDFLKAKHDPPASSHWSPNASYVSCDGRLAVNTGPWQSADRRTSGFFTTVWEQQEGKWRWISDGRHTLRKRMAVRQTPIVRTASCKGRAPGAPLSAPPSRQPGPGGAAPDDYGRGQSGDRTLGWEWRVRSNGARQFRAYLWNGLRYTVAVDQIIGSK
jgi:hypothetical protein